jgi:RhtB (resistance to homoserine/threonine) family protein
MIEQVFVIVGITFLILVSPGPDMVIVMRNTLIGGRNAGLVTSAGILAGNLVHITYCVLGIGWLISKSILAFTVLKYAGAAYLIYLGITSFRSDKTALDASLSKSGKVDRGWFLQGFINNILNPKGTLFYLGVFSVVITPGTSAAITVLLVLIMQGMCVLFWLFFVFTLDHPAIRRGIERFQKTVHRVFGALLVFLGIRVLTMER